MFHSLHWALPARQCEFICSYFTYQFNDYSKYDLIEGLEPLRAKQRDEQFPKDLQDAYDLGKRLVEMAKG